MRADQELFGDPLPTYLTRFVGREQELSRLAALVGSARVVTVCGVGGSGKSRLAVEFARRLSRDPARGGFRDGVVWASLATVAGPDALPRAVAAALGLREAAGGGATRAVQRSLEEQRLLLVLDGCEQVADACAELLDGLLQVCPGVSVLATSRRPLGCEAEVVFGLPSLDQGRPEKSDAVALFIDRGTFTGPWRELTEADSQATRDICERLGALPLAIELVASRVGVLSPRDLLETLSQTDVVLGSDAPAVGGRHLSLDSVLDSTWGWLAAEDRRVLCDLGIFRGGFDRAGAEAVAGASLSSLSVLADRSLIQRMPDDTGGSRYHMHELVREYALERLAVRGAESVEQVQARHFDYVLSLVEHARAAWDTDDEQRALVAIEADQANVETAMDWAAEAEQADRALSMAAELAALWINVEPLRCSATLLTRALDLPWAPSSPAAVTARSRALNLAGHTALSGGDVDLAALRFEEAVTLSEQLADPGSTARSLRGLGAVKRQSGDAAAGAPYVQRSLALCRETGDDPGLAWCRCELGEIAFASGRLDEALGLFEEAVSSFARLGIGCGSYRAYVRLGQLHVHRAEPESALGSFGHALTIQGRRSFVTYGAEIIEGTASVAAQLRRFELAATLLGAGDSWREAFDHPRITGLPPDDTAASRSTIRQLGPDAFGEAYEAGRRLTSAWSQTLLGSAITELTTCLSAPPAGLTGREVEVLRFVALGLSNGDIAAQLGVSPRTVHAHLRSIFEKLGVTTRTAAAHEAARIGVT